MYPTERAGKRARRLLCGPLALNPPLLLRRGGRGRGARRDRNATPGARRAITHAAAATATATRLALEDDGVLVRVVVEPRLVRHRRDRHADLQRQVQVRRSAVERQGDGLGV